MTDKQEGMLVAAPERWDEACFAVPALRAMVASGLAVGILCPIEQRDFWKMIEGLVVIDFPLRAKSKSVAAGIRGDWQVSLAWEHGFAAEVFKIAEIPKRLGQDERKLKKLLTHPIGFAVGPLEHRVRYYLSAVEALGMEPGNAMFFTPLAIGIEPVKSAVLLCPGSDFGVSHEWPLDRWVEIGKKLLESGRQVTVAGVDGGRGMGKNLAEILGQGVEFFHAAPLTGVLPLLAVHGLVVAADGSLPHLAAHAGATCVVLFGPNDPAWKRPLGKRHGIVRRHVECAPCFLAKCPLDMRCQRELTVDRVWEVIQTKLA